ncbi:MAG: hypothetical protein ACRCTZ_15100 [Sarcina sp.]
MERGFFRNGKEEIDFRQYQLINYYSLLAMNRFKWVNLPDGIESRHIEQGLLETGKVFFAEAGKLDKNLKGFVCLPCVTTSEPNIYGDPKTVELVSRNGDLTSIPISTQEGVLIRDNDTGYSPIEYIYDFAEKMSRVEFCQKRNLDQSVVPTIFYGNENEMLSIKNLMNDIKNKVANIIWKTGKKAKSKDKLSIDDKPQIEVLDTKFKLYLKEYDDHAIYEENRLLTYFGINNTNTQKRERLNQDEVNANNDFINMCLYLAYNNRLLARDYINEKYGINIDVIIVKDMLKEKEEKTRR